MKDHKIKILLLQKVLVLQQLLHNLILKNSTAKMRRIYRTTSGASHSCCGVLPTETTLIINLVQAVDIPLKMRPEKGTVRTG